MHILVIFTLIAIAVLIALFLQIRSLKVSNFRNQVADMIYEKNDELIQMSKFDKRIDYDEYLEGENSYERMLFSFKMLKLENFYTKEQIERLSLAYIL